MPKLEWEEPDEDLRYATYRCGSEDDVEATLTRKQTGLGKNKREVWVWRVWGRAAGVDFDAAVRPHLGAPDEYTCRGRCETFLMSLFPDLLEKGGR